MDIYTPIPTWILAKLYEEEHPIERKTLLKNLCQASFDLMNEDSEFSNILTELQRAKYIERSDGTKNGYDIIQYEITEYGIIAFRRKFGNLFEKIKIYADKSQEIRSSKFSPMVRIIKHSSDMSTTVAKMCIDNAPLVLEFLKYAGSELMKLGININ